MLAKLSRAVVVEGDERESGRSGRRPRRPRRAPAGANLPRSRDLCRYLARRLSFCADRRAKRSEACLSDARWSLERGRQEEVRASLRRSRRTFVRLLAQQRTVALPLSKGGIIPELVADLHPLSREARGLLEHRRSRDEPSPPRLPQTPLLPIAESLFAVTLLPVLVSRRPDPISPRRPAAWVRSRGGSAWLPRPPPAPSLPHQPSLRCVQLCSHCVQSNS